MKIRWCVEKARVLKFRYGFSFLRLIRCRFLGAKPHPGRQNQRMMFFEREDYVWVIPFVMDEQGIFLKTLYPSRKYTRLYWEGWFDEEKDRLE